LNRPIRAYNEEIGRNKLYRIVIPIASVSGQTGVVLKS